MTHALNSDKPHPQSLTLDRDGHLIDTDLWSVEVAQTLADTLSVTLTDEHIAILLAVRAYYEQFGHSPTTRPLIKFLALNLPAYQIDNAKLQTLFNTGLVARHVNRLAGLPKPANCL